MYLHFLEPVLVLPPNLAMEMAISTHVVVIWMPYPRSLLQPCSRDITLTMIDMHPFGRLVKFCLPRARQQCNQSFTIGNQLGVRVR